jgi:hypothetical protein
MRLCPEKPLIQWEREAEPRNERVGGNVAEFGTNADSFNTL